MDLRVKETKEEEVCRIPVSQGPVDLNIEDEDKSDTLEHQLELIKACEKAYKLLNATAGCAVEASSIHKVYQRLRKKFMQSEQDAVDNFLIDPNGDDVSCTVTGKLRKQLDIGGIIVKEGLAVCLSMKAYGLMTIQPADGKGVTLELDSHKFADHGGTFGKFMQVLRVWSSYSRV